MEVSGQIHASVALHPWKKADTHWIGSWVCPRTSLDAVEKIKILHCRQSNPNRPAGNMSLYWLSYHGVRLCRYFPENTTNALLFKELVSRNYGNNTLRALYQKIDILSFGPICSAPTFWARKFICTGYGTVTYINLQYPIQINFIQPFRRSETHIPIQTTGVIPKTTFSYSGGLKKCISVEVSRSFFSITVLSSLG
jgi:hypothetical protein